MKRKKGKSKTFFFSCWREGGGEGRGNRKKGIPTISFCPPGGEGNDGGPTFFPWLQEREEGKRRMTVIFSFLEKRRGGKRSPGRGNTRSHQSFLRGRGERGGEVKGGETANLYSFCARKRTGGKIISNKETGEEKGKKRRSLLKRLLTKPYRKGGKKRGFDGCRA